MRVVVEIHNNQAAFGIEELKKLGSIKSIGEEDLTDSFEAKWSNSRNLTIEDARELSK